MKVSVIGELGFEDMFEKRFDEFCTESEFIRVFNSRLRGKNGGGRDCLTPEQYRDKHPDDFARLANECLLGMHKFAHYNERLIIKGRNKYPRVISIPTVRDRLVLSVLNEYLQQEFGNLVNRKPANQYISDIQAYLAKHKNQRVSFFKTDFSGFYDTVNRDRLIEMLNKKNLHPHAAKLIIDSINTPTSNNSSKRTELTEYGIPQGLAISNILSALYLEEFDEFFRQKADLYLRYVDDILMLNPDEDDMTYAIESYILEHNLNLYLNKEKTNIGVIGETDLNFVGYNFTKGKISLRKDNVTSFFNRLVKECISFRNQFNDKYLRPTFLQKDDDEFQEVMIERINLSITGIKCDNSFFGWIHHYKQLTDLSLLYSLDKALRNRFLSFVSESHLKNLKTFRRCYYDIMDGRASEVAFDFDIDGDLPKMKAFMLKKGWLDSDIDYTEEEITKKYQKIKRSIKKKMERHIGRIS